MYSSCLWNLFGLEANKLYNQWNVLIRTLWDVPRETHRRLIEPLSENIHLKTTLMKRFLSFSKSILSTEKESVRYLANRFLFNCESLSGMNLRRINLECGIDMILCKKREFLQHMPPFVELNEEEKWKAQAIHEIISIIQGYGTIINDRQFDDVQDFDSRELRLILNDLCCN